MYCIIIDADNPYDAVLLYSNQFNEHHGKYVIIVDINVIDGIKHAFQIFNACEFAYYTPESFLHLYLTCITHERTYGQNIFIYNLRQHSGIVATTERKVALPWQHLPDDESWDVFISYSHKENNGLIPDLYERLNEMDKKVFLDFVSIPTGDSFVEKIIRGIMQSLAYVLLLNNEYLDANWTKAELIKISYQCVEHHKKFIAVCLDNAGFALIQEGAIGDIVVIRAENMNSNEITSKIIEELQIN